ncbi:MAG: hypothetical protein JW929_12980 [Anaerolineales bacterium]|nr:hypothetical protein [Anaerolineales bacterium]
MLDVSQPAPAGLAALYGPDSVPLALALTAQIALRRPVWVIDGGNRFDALWLAEYAARLGQPPEPVLDRIHISRAFTCHQMAERILSLPAEAAPLVILHLLDTFYDENVPITEARRLLNALWPVLRRRSREVPVAVTLRPPRSERVADREGFYSGILRRADRRVGPELENPAPPPPPALPGFESYGRRSRQAGTGAGEDRDFRHPLPPMTDLSSTPPTPLPIPLRGGGEGCPRPGVCQGEGRGEEARSGG